MRQWTMSHSVRITNCGLWGTEHLPEPMITYCQTDSKEQTVNQNVNQNRKIFIQQNVFWKGRMQNADHYVSTPMS